MILDRLVLEVVIMVLRGEQFQRFGPAGCINLTRRALSSYRATSPIGQFDAVCLLGAAGCRTDSCAIPTAKIGVGNLRRTRVHGVSK